MDVLDIGVRDLNDQLDPVYCRAVSVRADLQDLLAREQIPLLPDFGLDEMVERVGRDKVDKCVPDLILSDLAVQEDSCSLRCNNC